jgi:DMSO/TMAO reductase YedYZ molybdopterin-dependent catalytic subunit
LRVFGSGLRQEDGIELTYDHLLRLPSRSTAAFIECAGNGRSFFGTQQGTPVSGTQWKLGAVGVSMAWGAAARGARPSAWQRRRTAAAGRVVRSA